MQNNIQLKFKLKIPTLLFTQPDIYGNKSNFLDITCEQFSRNTTSLVTILRDEHGF